MSKVFSAHAVSVDGDADAIAAAREAAGDKDVCLMGGEVVR